MNTSKLWIGGQEQEPSTGEYFDDLNPSNSDLIARVAKGSAEDVDAAIKNAKDTFEKFKDFLFKLALQLHTLIAIL